MIPNRLTKGILDFVFPLRCVICGQLVDTGTRPVPICDSDNRELFTPIESPYCNQCGRPLRSYSDDSDHDPNSDRAPLCGECRTRRHRLDFLLPGFRYNTRMSPIVADWKYDGRKSWGPWLGKKLAQRLNKKLKPTPWDGLVPIPLHARRRKERGFNQAVQLGDQLSGEFGLPVMNPLQKHRRTDAQSNLSRSERKENLEGAFSLVDNQNRIQGKNLLLVDDIYTTGSTLETVAKTLLENGVRRVAGLVLLRTDPLS